MCRRSKIVLAVSVVVIVTLGGFVIWVKTSLGPMLEVYKSLESDSFVKVSTEKWLIFQLVNYRARDIADRPFSQTAPKGYVSGGDN